MARAPADRKHMAVHRDFWAFQTKRSLDLKLKFNWDYFEIILHGLDFGFDKLNEDELADCLD